MSADEIRKRVRLWLNAHGYAGASELAVTAACKVAAEALERRCTHTHQPDGSCLDCSGTCLCKDCDEARLYRAAGEGGEVEGERKKDL